MTENRSAKFLPSADYFYVSSEHRGLSTLETHRQYVCCKLLYDPWRRRGPGPCAWRGERICARVFLARRFGARQSVRVAGRAGNRRCGTAGTLPQFRGVREAGKRGSEREGGEKFADGKNCEHTREHTDRLTTTRPPPLAPQRPRRRQNPQEVPRRGPW